MEKKYQVTSLKDWKVQTYKDSLFFIQPDGQCWVTACQLASFIWPDTDNMFKIIALAHKWDSVESAKRHIRSVNNKHNRLLRKHEENQKKYANLQQ